jgi:hypothetical protein
MLACGGQAQPAKAPEPAAPIVEQMLAGSAQRKPSPDVSRYWLLGDRPPVSLYGDLSTLLHSELVASLAPALLEQLADALKGGERACISALLEHSKELLVGGDQSSGLVVLSLGTEGVKAARTACVGSLLPGERVTLQGAEEAYRAGNGAIAVMPGVVLAGTRSQVEAALAAGATPTALPEHLALKDDEQVAFGFALPTQSIFVAGTLSASPRRFLLAGQAQLPNDAAADALDKKVSMGRAQAKLLTQAMSGDASMARLLDAVHIERRGSSFHVRFELLGAPAEQARDLGAVAALGVHGARKYMLNAKAAEARVILGQITKSYQASLVVPAGAKPKAPKKLLSLPAVPAAVPRGARYASSADDWKPWAAIQFQLDQPQYFQYEVVAAKDGKNADVLARGDLDGDGVTSLYRLKIQLDPKTGQLTAQNLDETEPFE